MEEKLFEARGYLMRAFVAVPTVQPTDTTCLVESRIPEKQLQVQKADSAIDRRIIVKIISEKS